MILYISAWEDFSLASLRGVKGLACETRKILRDISHDHIMGRFYETSPMITSWGHFTAHVKPFLSKHMSLFRGDFTQEL